MKRFGSLHRLEPSVQCAPHWLINVRTRPNVSNGSFAEIRAPLPTVWNWPTTDTGYPNAR
jgi:hypothetical protein